MRKATTVLSQSGDVVTSSTRRLQAASKSALPYDLVSQSALSRNFEA
jgi:hypothetical protein